LSVQNAGDTGVIAHAGRASEKNLRSHVSIYKKRNIFATSKNGLTGDTEKKTDSRLYFDACIRISLCEHIFLLS
jgi:hypothetical protein